MSVENDYSWTVFTIYHHAQNHSYLPKKTVSHKGPNLKCKIFYQRIRANNQIANIWKFIVPTGLLKMTTVCCFSIYCKYDWWNFGANMIFPAFWCINAHFILAQTLFSKLFKPNAGKIMSLCWEISFLAQGFHQSHLKYS